eukprot:PhM_4_TR3441/c1_g2_i1/m.21961
MSSSPPVSAPAQHLAHFNQPPSDDVAPMPTARAKEFVSACARALAQNMRVRCTIAWETMNDGLGERVAKEVDVVVVRTQKGRASPFASSTTTVAPSGTKSC